MGLSLLIPCNNPMTKRTPLPFFLALARVKLSSAAGATGISNNAGSNKPNGIPCTLGHSTVGDSIAPGNGRRLDHCRDRDPDAGAMTNLASDASP